MEAIVNQPWQLESMDDKVIFISGGTGSLGNELVRRIGENYKPKKVIIFSRDEYKQSVMASKYDYPFLRFLIGDIRDSKRLKQVCHADYVIHAAALKRIPAMEYNPTEAVKTNVDGTVNVIEACIANGVKKAILTSTDKAVNPINLYGATKLCAEKLFKSANIYGKTKFAVVRYGNVLNSRGSVVEMFLKLKEQGVKEFPITDPDMTRFWITLEEAASLVVNGLIRMIGGETFIPHIPSMKITDIARAIEPECEFKIIGIRPGEKMHEVLISKDERVILFNDSNNGQKVGEYSSNMNKFWLTPEGLREKIGL